MTVLRACCVVAILVVIVGGAATGVFFAVRRPGERDDPLSNTEAESEETGTSNAKNFGDRDAPVEVLDIFFGLSYSPFGLGDNRLCEPFDDIGGMCILEDQVKADMRLIASMSTRVKTYSLNCLTQTASIVRFARDNGMKVMLGVWTDRIASKNDVEVGRLRSILTEFGGDDVISHIQVGNEALFVQGATESELLRQIQLVKTMLTDLGLTIPVGTAEIYAVWTGTQTAPTPGSRAVKQTTPLDSIAGAIDWIGLNVHPYYAGVDPSTGLAAQHVEDEAAGLEAFWAARGFPLKVHITETGYPTVGDPNPTSLGIATPSVAGLDLFIGQITDISRNTGREVYFFEPFNGDWKRRWLPYIELDYSFGVFTCDRAIKEGITLPAPR